MSWANQQTTTVTLCESRDGQDVKESLFKLYQTHEQEWVSGVPLGLIREYWAESSKLLRLHDFDFDARERDLAHRNPAWARFWALRMDHESMINENGATPTSTQPLRTTASRSIRTL